MGANSQGLKLLVAWEWRRPQVSVVAPIVLDL
jgi:hypothetical protein